MVDPPKSEDESFALFQEERKRIFTSLQKKADIVSKSLNQIEGIIAQPTEGAMYSFPLIQLPQAVIIKLSQFFTFFSLWH